MSPHLPPASTSPPWRGDVQRHCSLNDQGGFDVKAMLFKKYKLYKQKPPSCRDDSGLKNECNQPLFNVFRL